MGFCPGCPEGGWGGGRVVGKAAHCTFSPAFPGKRVEDPCIYWTTLGPGTFPMISLVPGPACPVPAFCRCPSCCDRQGPILKSHPRAIQFLLLTEITHFTGLRLFARFTIAQPKF